MMQMYQLTLEPATDEERHGRRFREEIENVVQELEALGLCLSRGRRCSDLMNVSFFLVKQTHPELANLFDSKAAAVLATYISACPKRHVRLKIGDEEFVALSPANIQDIFRTARNECSQDQAGLT